MFKNVIVKTPGDSYIKGLTTSNLGTPILTRAIERHTSYIEALKTCGIKVTYYLEIMITLIQRLLRILLFLLPTLRL